MSDRKGRDGPWATYPRGTTLRPLSSSRGRVQRPQHPRLQNASESGLRNLASRCMQMHSRMWTHAVVLTFKKKRFELEHSACAG